MPQLPTNPDLWLMLKLGSGPWVEAFLLRMRGYARSGFDRGDIRNVISYEIIARSRGILESHYSRSTTPTYLDVEMISTRPMIEVPSWHPSHQSPKDDFDQLPMLYVINDGVRCHSPGSGLPIQYAGLAKQRNRASSFAVFSQWTFSVMAFSEF